MSSDPPPVAELLDGISVLIVEDVDDAREMLVILLHAHGATVTSAGSVRDALAALDQAEFDVIVSDISMPSPDGLDLLRTLRARPVGQGGTIPAIALTALNSPEDHQAILAAGFQAHVCKPSAPGELASVIRAVTGAC